MKEKIMKNKELIIFLLIIFSLFFYYMITWRYEKHNDSTDLSDLFAESEKCSNSLGQNQPETMEWYPDTTITIWCFSERLWQPEKTWYIYTTVYPDLWLRVTSTKWNESFFSKSNTPIFDRSWDTVSYNNGDEYIKIYPKSPETTLKDILDERYKKCILITLNSIGQEIVRWNISSTSYLYSSDNKNNPSEACPDLWEHSLRFYESWDWTKYYEILFRDWCSKLPCRIFEKIEIE